MEQTNFIPMAKRLRMAAAGLRRMIDAGAESENLSQETAEILLAAAQRHESHAEALDPTVGEQPRESAAAA